MTDQPTSKATTDDNQLPARRLADADLPKVVKIAGANSAFG